MGQNELLQLDLKTLKVMYAKAASQLKRALIDGTPWDDVQEIRHDVTDLEAALYQKVRMPNPAENNTRDRNLSELIFVIQFP
jgi:hypothetical protein